MKLFDLLSLFIGYTYASVEIGTRSKLLEISSEDLIYNRGSQKDGTQIDYIPKTTWEHVTNKRWTGGEMKDQDLFHQNKLHQTRHIINSHCKKMHHYLEQPACITVKKIQLSWSGPFIVSDITPCYPGKKCTISPKPPISLSCSVYSIHKEHYNWSRLLDPILPQQNANLFLDLPLEFKSVIQTNKTGVYAMGFRTYYWNLSGTTNRFVPPKLENHVTKEPFSVLLPARLNHKSPDGVVGLMNLCHASHLNIKFKKESYFSEICEGKSRRRGEGIGSKERHQ